MLIIGCGNLERGDDAVGLLVARRLRERGIAAEECSGDALRLLDRWNAGSEVILIDAVVTGSRPGSVFVWDVPVGDKVVTLSTHGIGIGEALRLARQLGRLPRSVRIYGIEAGRFDFGSTPSAEPLAAVERVATEIAGLAAGALGTSSG